MISFHTLLSADLLTVFESKYNESNVMCPRIVFHVIKVLLCVWGEKQINVLVQNLAFPFQIQIMVYYNSKEIQLYSAFF